jgi:hypothetical protein
MSPTSGARWRQSSLVEAEVAGGPLDQGGVGQGHRRVDDRVAILQGGLEDGMTSLGRPA